MNTRLDAYILLHFVAWSIIEHIFNYHCKNRKSGHFSLNTEGVVNCYVKTALRRSLNGTEYLPIINLTVQHYGISVCVFFAAWWQKRKVKIGVFPKEVLNLETEIKKLMYSLDNTPVSVVEDQGRFTEVMAAFHQYERTVRCVRVLLYTG